MGQRWKVPGYAVEEFLGRGGSGEVWAARVARSGDRVALKRVLIADPAALERFRTEAAVLTALDHPNLVRLLDIVTAGDDAVLVLDLAAGGSLAQLLDARGRLSAGEAITALAPVAAALAHAHAASVVHGDVSAANVLFTRAGLPLLGDLGVARLLGDTRPVFSTPAYVDPGVAAGAPPTPASDVFMLGGVLLHALTGEPTWPGATAGDVLGAAVAFRLDAAARLAEVTVPEATAFVVRRALHADPDRRGTAAEFALDLRASGRPAAVELAAGRPPASGRRGTATPSAASQRATAAAEPEAAGRPVVGRPDVRPPDVPPSRPFDRPDFERPARLSDEARAQSPATRLVAARARPTLPRPASRRAAWASRRVVIGAAATVVALGAILFAVVLPGHGTPARPIGAVDPASRTGSSGVVVGSSSAATASSARRHRSSASRPPSTVPAAGSAADWVLQLRRLDSKREQAFARARPGLLGAVYADGRLRDADARQLRSLVPAGCTLGGVRTAYRSPRFVLRGDRSATVLVWATLARSTLRCAGTSAVVPGAGPVLLRIQLSRTASGVRIAAQSRV